LPKRNPLHAEASEIDETTAEPAGAATNGDAASNIEKSESLSGAVETFASFQNPTYK
jgi:hypothetical protein